MAIMLVGTLGLFGLLLGYGPQLALEGWGWLFFSYCTAVLAMTMLFWEATAAAGSWVARTIVGITHVPLRLGVWVGPLMIALGNAFPSPYTLPWEHRFLAWAVHWGLLPWHVNAGGTSFQAVSLTLWRLEMDYAAVLLAAAVVLLIITNVELGCRNLVRSIRGLPPVVRDTTFVDRYVHLFDTKPPASPQRITLMTPR